jgi:hypothetical protein
MFIQSIPCAQIPSFPPNGQAPWNAQVGLGCPGMCGGSGMGLFDSGFDISNWGWEEWLTVVGGLYAVVSVFSTTSRAARSVHRKTRAALRA